MEVLIVLTILEPDIVLLVTVYRFRLSKVKNSTTTAVVLKLLKHHDLPRPVLKEVPPKLLTVLAGSSKLTLDACVNLLR